MNKNIFDVCWAQVCICVSFSDFVQLIYWNCFGFWYTVGFASKYNFYISKKIPTKYIGARDGNA